MVVNEQGVAFRNQVIVLPTRRHTSHIIVPHLHMSHGDHGAQRADSSAQLQPEKNEYKSFRIPLSLQRRIP